MSDTPSVTPNAVVIHPEFDGVPIEMMTPILFGHLIHSFGTQKALNMVDIDSITDHDTRVVCRVLAHSYESLLRELTLIRNDDNNYDFNQMLAEVCKLGTDKVLSEVSGELEMMDNSNVRIICRTILSGQEALTEIVKNLSR